MDPFQHTSRTPQAFRAVPMTHLATTQRSGWTTLATSAATLLGPQHNASVSPMPHGSAVDPLRMSSASSIGVGRLMAPAEADGGSCASNLRKWQQFGLRVGTQEPMQNLGSRRLESSCDLLHDMHASAGQKALAANTDAVASAPPAQPRRPPADVRATTKTAPTIPFSGTRREAPVSIDDDDVAVVELASPPRTSAVPGARSGRELRQRSPSSPSPAAPMPPSEAITSSLAAQAHASASGADVVARRLQLELAQLSEKVQHTTEEQRCGPPKRTGGGGGGGGSSWGGKRWGGKKDTKKKTEAKAGRQEDSSHSHLSNDDVREDEGQACEDSKDDRSKQKPTGKRGRASATSAKETGKRKRRGEKGAAEGSSATAATSSSSGAPPTRTLFSLSATGAAGNALASMHGAATAAVTVNVPFFFLQSSVEDLFSDMRRALNDPDRIQAPPLFVGLSTLSSSNSSGAVGASPQVECRTNFTFHSGASKAAKGRASNCLSASVDPLVSHQHVELVLVRWKDAVYAMPAQTLGFSFLCRVLVELPGVELITFNAQTLLVALLAYSKGSLWSSCISDVRVMAWMAQLHVVTASQRPAQQPLSALPAAARDGAAGGGEAAGDTDMNVLYDYEQLLALMCGGKVPPSVQLDRSGEADSSLGNNTNHSGASATYADGEAPAPPLTPVHRRLAQQVYYLATVYRSLYGHLGSKGLLQPFLRQEKRIALLLALMRFNGIGVDLHEVHRYQKSCEAEMTRQRTLANELVPEMGDDFNIQSHDQCRKALYEVLLLGKFLTAKPPGGDSGGGERAAGTGLTVTKGGRLSTAEDTLRALAPHHDFPTCLLRYRKASKLMQTYLEGMMSYAIVRPGKQDAASLLPSVAHPATAAAEDGDRALAAPLEILGETAVLLDDGDDSPFVDRHLETGTMRFIHTDARSAAGRPRQPAALPPAHADEEASVTAIGDVALPSCGYATIHPNFVQEGTDTGRLSCVEPNLQNLPRNAATTLPAAAAGDKATADGDEGGGEEEEDLLGFRRCFVAPAGFVLLSVDYQQIELRVLAHLCGDMALVGALTQSADIHRAIAELVFRKRPVSSEERGLAKRVVFGVLYGAGPKTLAAQMGVSVERALHISSLLTNAFPGIETYHRRVVEESRMNGFVRTLSGRLRFLPDIRSTVLARRSYAERQAFNSVVQGSAADVMKMAMLAVAKDVLQRYSRAEVSLLSQIHDEMVFLVRKDLLSAVVPLVSSAMSHAMHLLVPLSVTVKFGLSLGELQEWSVENDLGLGVDE